MKDRNLQAQAASIFLKAANYIRRYGWQGEGMGQPGRPRCSMGALDSAHPQTEWDKQLANLMYQTLYDELGGLSLTQYNHKVQDGEQVARLYDRVARRLQRG